MCNSLAELDKEEEEENTLMLEKQSDDVTVPVPQDPTPKEQVIKAERDYMKSQSLLVNQFNPTTQDFESVDTAAKKVEELYAKYPEHKPVPTTKPNT